LVEKSSALGGQLRHVHYTLEHANVAAYLAELVARVQNHPQIKLYLNSSPCQISGHVGHFTTRIRTDQAEQTLSHGVVILAIGGDERKTQLYLYGQYDNVLLQRELEEKIATDTLPETLGDRPTVVMIQCVDSRNETHPYCSRVCCAAAVKNALALKARNPQTQVVILFRDMRTYGFRETYYQQAREAGVLFIRYPDAVNPEVIPDKGGGIRVHVVDSSTGRQLDLGADLLVLSTGIAPSADHPLLSGLLRTALTSDGFFLEAHPKLRPVDLANEGEYLCGIAHSPRFIDETIAQAKAVAGRAATVLSRSYLEIAGQVAKVDPTMCVACATCVKVCPYGAPKINELKKAEIQGAKCMGCGSCAAECPARTITLQHQEDGQVTAMLDVLLTCAGAAP
jgi:heterodisulfide reductase subunit A2